MNQPDWARRLVFWLVVINCLLLIGHLVFAYILFNVTMTEQTYFLLLKLDMDQEVSVPTWFAQSLLLGNAVASAVIAWRVDGEAVVKRGWWIVTGLLVFLSLDEGASVHEMLTAPVVEFSNTNIGLLTMVGWVVPVAVVGTLIAMILWRWFVALNAGQRKKLIVAGLIFVGGAVGIETFGAYYVIQNGGVFDELYMLIAGLEEWTENAGSLVALSALLSQNMLLRKRL